MSGGIGGISFVEVEAVQEIVMLGDHNGRVVLVLGTRGGDEVWTAACAVADVMEKAGQNITNLLVIDVNTASARPATLRKIPSARDPFEEEL